MTKISYVCSHPIHYHAELLRRLASIPDIEFEAVFRTDAPLRGAVDLQFGIPIKWNVNLTDGYRYSVLQPESSENYGTARTLFKLMSYLVNRRPDILWVHGFSNMYNLLAMIVAKSLRCRVYLRDDVNGKMRNRAWLDNFKSIVIFRLLRILVDGFLAVGSENKRYYLKRGIPGNRIILVPNAVDNEFFQNTTADTAAAHATMEQLRSKYKVIVLFCGKLIAVKRVGDLLRALSHIPKSIGREIAVVVVGEGECRAQLEAQAACCGIATYFLGFINQSGLPSIYKSSDVLVLPSASESWGLVINEAMNGACAVIATDRVGAAADLIKEGINGYVYKVGDTVTLGRLLTQLASEPDVLKRFKESSLQIIRSWNYDADIAGLRAAFRLSYDAAE